MPATFQRSAVRRPLHATPRHATSGDRAAREDVIETGEISFHTETQPQIRSDWPPPERPQRVQAPLHRNVKKRFIFVEITASNNLEFFQLLLQEYPCSSSDVSSIKS